MKFNFRKIMSVATSAIMLGSTFGIAAAATYPEPFVKGGAADGAIVVGANAVASDWQAAIDLKANLDASTASGSSSATVTGEAYPLFTSATNGKIYYNDSIAKTRSAVTSSELPTILKDGDFDGDVSATFTQRVDVYAELATGKGLVTYAQQPTSNDDPQVGIVLGTTQANQLYNYTVTFNKGVNFTHADSKKQTLILAGQKYTVSSATAASKGLVLFKSSETLDLSIGGTAPNPSQKVTVAGKEYTIELKSGTDTSATVKVTDSAGASDTKEITEGTSKRIQGVEVAVNLADESTATNSVSAEVTVGADKMILKHGASIKLGSDETSVSGTYVTIGGALTAADAITKLTVTVWEHDGNYDAILSGKSYMDPVFETFKIDFAGMSSSVTSTSGRELITVTPSTDKASVKFTNHKDVEKSLDFLYNESGYKQQLKDGSAYDYNIIEMAQINESELVMVGNEDNGYLLKLLNVENSSSGTTPNANVVFQDVFSGTEYKATVTTDHDAEVYIGGNKYTVYYNDDDAKSGEEYARLNYPDSTSVSQVIVFPTIETSLGAKLFLYQPTNVTFRNYIDGGTIDAGGWDGRGNNVTKLSFPDGDGYTDINIGADLGANGKGGQNWSIGTGNLSLGQDLICAGLGVCYNSTTQTVGALTYNFTQGGANATIIKLIDPVDGGNINTPAIVIFEEEDDNNAYQAQIIQMGGSGTTTVPVTVEDVINTFDTVGLASSVQGETNDKLYTRMDLWGTLSTVDKSDTDQYTATLSYPDSQVYAQIYVGENAAAITPETVVGSASSGKVVVVKDSEVDSVSDKNLVVIGGSCINSVAAKILGSDTPLCGDDFSAKTKVSAGGYLLKVAASPYAATDSGKIAMLVAGYNAEDTTAAAAAVKAGASTEEGETVYPVATA